MATTQPIFSSLSLEELIDRTERGLIEELGRRRKVVFEKTRQQAEARRQSRDEESRELLEKEINVIQEEENADRADLDLASTKLREALRNAARLPKSTSGNTLDSTKTQVYTGDTHGIVNMQSDSSTALSEVSTQSPSCTAASVATNNGRLSRHRRHHTPLDIKYNEDDMLDQPAIRSRKRLAPASPLPGFLGARLRRSTRSSGRDVE